MRCAETVVTTQVTTMASWSAKAASTSSRDPLPMGHPTDATTLITAPLTEEQGKGSHAGRVD